MLTWITAHFIQSILRTVAVLSKHVHVNMDHGTLYSVHSSYSSCADV